MSAPGPRVRVARFAFIVVVTAHAPPSACPRVGPARLELQAVARRGKSRTIAELRRGFIEAAMLEQGYQESEVASFLGCHPSNVSRGLQKRGNKI
jgi:DNA-binding NtrC family response regulator